MYAAQQVATESELLGQGCHRNTYQNMSNDPGSARDGRQSRERRWHTVRGQEHARRDDPCREGCQTRYPSSPAEAPAHIVKSRQGVAERRAREEQPDPVEAFESP